VVYSQKVQIVYKNTALHKTAALTVATVCKP